MAASTALILIGIAVAVVAVYAGSLVVHPWWPCRRCKGTGRTQDLLWRKASGTCPSCGGRGRKPRLGVRVFQPARGRRMIAREQDHKRADERKQ